jgi:hypothetical protein
LAIFATPSWLKLKTGCDVASGECNSVVVSNNTGGVVTHRCWRRWSCPPLEHERGVHAATHYVVGRNVMPQRWRASVPLPWPWATPELNACLNHQSESYRQHQSRSAHDVEGRQDRLQARHRRQEAHRVCYRRRHQLARQQPARGGGRVRGQDDGAGEHLQPHLLLFSYRRCRGRISV